MFVYVALSASGCVMLAFCGRTQALIVAHTLFPRGMWDPSPMTQD